MRRFLSGIFALIVGVLAAMAQAPAPAKILFLVGGEYHDYDALPKTVVQRLRDRLQDSVAVEFTITKDVGAFRKAELSKYDAIMINVCEQTALDAEEKDGFLEAVKAGMPVVALHCTFWSFQDWPEFKDVLGAFVPGHGHLGTFCLKAENAQSSILKNVPQTFELTDEPYIVNERDPLVDVLVKTCQSVQERPGTEPEVWTKTYGKGKIFAMTFGHDARAQDDPNYLTLLSHGLLWALGRMN
jgi:uncharacterized protein